MIVVVFSFLENGSFEIALLIVYAGGSFFIFNKVNKEINYHNFVIHKIEVILHALILWTVLIVIFGKVNFLTSQVNIEFNFYLSV